MAARKASKSKPDDTVTPAAPSAEKTKAHPTAAPLNYVVFARRFRPQRFEDVAGQNAVTSALKQALRSGRLAQAYLFCGPRGVGKTSLARIIAKALNCMEGRGPNGFAEEPCNQCEACLSIQNGNALDVIEMDAATNRGIEEIRSLRDNVGIAPAVLRQKVYIIDEVHMLTREAWNAFLKTLEEPPAHVKFIFATTDPNNVPETILSRCQRYDLRRIGPADIVKRLKQICELEKLGFEEMALSRIASLAKGGLRDAEGLLDQAVNLGGGTVTDAAVRDLSGSAPDETIFKILSACAQGNTAEVLLHTHHVLDAGADPEDLASSLSENLRGTLMAKVCGTDSPTLEGLTHLKSSFEELGKMLSEEQMLMLLQLFGAARRSMRDATQARLPLEMALIRASKAKDLVDLGKLVSALESGAQTAQPPTREGSRPNSPGRPVGIAESRPAAAMQPVAASAAVARPMAADKAPVAQTRTAQPELAPVVAAANERPGGKLLASALSHVLDARVDKAAGTCELIFSAEQLFYLEQLKRPETLALLESILLAVFGQKHKVVLTRGSGTSTPRRAPAPIAPPPAPVQSPPATPESEHFSDEPPPFIEGENESEVEFDDNDALPLGNERAPQPKPLRPLPVKPQNSAAPARTPPPMPVSRADTKSVENHPWVKMVLKETGGTVMNVIQGGSRAKEKDAGK